MTGRPAAGTPSPAFLAAVADVVALGADARRTLADAARALATFAPAGLLCAAVRTPEGHYVVAGGEGRPASDGARLATHGDAVADLLDAGLVADVGPGPDREAADEAASRFRVALVACPATADGRTFGALVLASPPADEREAALRAFAAAARIAGVAAARAADRDEAAAKTAALVETEKLAALGRLMAGVVHELGGPLQSIISLADVLERDPARDDRLESARRILRSAMRCKQIAQELLSFARRNPPRRRRVDPRAAVLDALDLDRYADVGDVDFRLESDAASAEVVCDPQRLAQVVLNLLANARAAVASLGARGVVRVQLENVDGALSRLPRPKPATAVRIAVEDRGPGVPDDLRAKIFDAFVTTKEEGRGTGLGLFVARQMVEESGGILYLDESYGPGARFVVELPAAAPGPASCDAEADPAQAGLRILAIDDDRDVLETYQVVLALDRHVVTACDRGKAALEACANADFDAILCDVRLPDLDGREFYSALCRLKPALAGRVVFATGDVTTPETQAFLASTPQPNLQKPFRIEELEAALRAVAPPREG